jgi:hypothetical protein
MKIKTTLIMSVLFASNAFAGTKIVKGLSEDKKIDISRVEKQITLVQKQKGDSDLRVSLVVTDNGGSTDVSPLSALYLTMHNESEMQGANSTHLISYINKLVSHKRVKAGVYEVIVTNYDYDQECKNDDYQKLDKITIDARELSVSVRNFDGISKDFGYGKVQDGVTVTTETICKKDRKK